jgi:hypothetical protein
MKNGMVLKIAAPLDPNFQPVVCSTASMLNPRKNPARPCFILWRRAAVSVYLKRKVKQPLYLKLIDTKVFSTGAMVQVYQPENLLNK